jgi:hypothetical protein
MKPKAQGWQIVERTGRIKRITVAARTLAQRDAAARAAKQTTPGYSHGSRRLG